MSAKRSVEVLRQSSFDETVLEDSRWEALAAGEATSEDVADLKAWAERSETAKAAWIMFQPVEKEVECIAINVLQALEACHGNASLVHKKVPRSDSIPTIRVFLIDDHPVLRDSLARALNAEPGMVVTGQAGTAAEAFHELPAAKADVVLVDLNVPDRDGIELLNALHTLHPHTKLLVLSGYSDEYRVAEALRAGAQGYLVKTAEITEVIEGIRDIVRGGSPLSSSIAGAVVRAMRKPTPEGTGGLDTLTHRERQVLRLLVAGRSTRETAAQLTISPKTVETHRVRIYQKLGCKSAVELTRIAVRMGATKGS